MAKKASKKTSKKTAKKKVSRRKGGVGGVAELPEAEPMYDPPIPLEAVVGHGRALGVLRASLESGRLHHAWIFHGPAGVGKMTAALAFAAMLLDPTLDRGLSGELGVDPESETQRLLRERLHPDLHVVRKELAAYSDNASVRASKQTTIAKDVVDEHLVRASQLAPSREGGLAGKVFIVDEAERLDASLSKAESQNAILKTLEEPPERTVIILVTSSEDRLLPTIRSRCQRVAFGPLTDEETVRVAGSKGIDASQAEAGLSLAGGSPGRLIELVETGVVGWQAELRPMLDLAARGRFASDLGPTMAGLVEGWAAARAASVPNGSKTVANREGAARMFELLATRARKGLAVEGAEDRALGWIEAIQRAESRVYANVQMASVFEGLAADLAS